MLETIMAVLFTPRPSSFRNKSREEVPLPDGEKALLRHNPRPQPNTLTLPLLGMAVKAVVWWPSPPSKKEEDQERAGNSGVEVEKRHEKRKLWVCLPGGMTHGDTFYLHGAEVSLLTPLPATNPNPYWSPPGSLRGRTGAYSITLA